MLDFQKLSALYQQALLRQVVPFWLKSSRDLTCGGYFDLLSAAGEVIEGDKIVVQQARQMWAFAWLYNTLDGQPAWLEHARYGAAFLNQFAHTDTVTCYGQLDRRGRPVAPTTSVEPDCATAMAYAQLHWATGSDEWAMLAKQLAMPLLEQWQATRARQIEELQPFRQVRQLRETTALLKMVLDIQPLLDEEFWKIQVDLLVQELLTEFVDRRTDILREHILPGGSFINTPEGRRVNVGLTFQTANYLLDFCTAATPFKTGLSGNQYRKLPTQITSWCLRLCEESWDEQAGGLRQFIDVKKRPLLLLDWQHKWAWIHTEALAALLKCYLATRHSGCLTWFRRIHDYTFQHFPDPKQTGWHLVIDQHSQPIIDVKSTYDVGCYSAIRCLTEVIQSLTKYEQLQTKSPATSSDVVIKPKEQAL